MNENHVTKKIASIPDRIRGLITSVLTFTCFILANYALHGSILTPAWVAPLMVAGMFYMLTSLAYVFENGFGDESES